MVWDSNRGIPKTPNPFHTVIQAVTFFGMVSENVTRFFKGLLNVSNATFKGMTFGHDLNHVADGIS